MSEEKQDQGAGSAEPRKVRTRASRNIARPPFTAASDIDALFERIQRIAPPGRVDDAWARGFSLSEKVVNVLEWLGVVNKDGTVVAERWNRIRLPATRQETLSELVKSSYDAIFEQVEIAGASREDLDGAIVVKYGLGDSRRYLKAFATLCKHAGIPLAFETRRSGSTASNPADGKPTAARSATSSPAPKTQRTSLRARPDPPTGESRGATVASGITVNVEIPAGWSEDEIRERLAEVNRLLNELKT